jgi:hypothetical protein
MSPIEQLTGTPLDELVRRFTGPLTIIALLLYVAWRRQGGKSTIWYRVPVSLDGMTFATNETRVGEPATSLVKVRSGTMQIAFLIVAGYVALRFHAEISTLFVFLQNSPWIAAVVPLVLAFLMALLHYPCLRRDCPLPR